MVASNEATNNNDRDSEYRLNKVFCPLMKAECVGRGCGFLVGYLVTDDDDNCKGAVYYCGITELVSRLGDQPIIDSPVASDLIR